MGLSNIEDILQAGLDGTEIPTPESRIAELLKEWIEQGGNVDDIFVAGANITLTKNSDGTITIAASGEISSEDTVARAEIAAIKDGETLDSFGDVETALGDKADSTTTYTKTEVDTALSAKANSTDVYSKTAVDTALGNKADKSTTYTKTEVDTSLGNKADKSTTYTKTEVDTALDNKVDKVSGKGLSTNDYTTAEKTKLAGIAQGAEVNEIEGIKVNSSTVNPDANKVVNITVPTTAADVSALPDTTKYAAALSLTINSSTFVMTGQLKDQNGDNLGTAQTIDLPLESVVVGGSYNSQTKKVVLTLQNGNTIEFSVADLISGLQTELSASNKLNPAYINYDSTHRAVSDTEKSTWNGKQNAIDDLTTIRSGAALGATAVQPETGKGLSSNDFTNAEKTKLDDLANIKSVGTGLSLNSSTGELTATGGGGTSDYTALSNKPQIAGTTLTGNKSLSELGIAPASSVTLVSGLNTTGTIKNGSSVTSATGYTASPIISGVPYYKDTTYESKSAVSGGTAVSLCTTGEKYTWNNKQSALSTTQLTAVNSGIDSTKVAQIAKNKNNISLITPTVKYSGDAFTVGTDYTLCDACTLTIPAPANGQSIRVANILAGLTFNNSDPRGIILSTSNRVTDYDNNLNLLAKIESTGYVFLSAQCMFLNYRNTAANIYVWVKSSSSAINRVISSMQLMN